MLSPSSPILPLCLAYGDLYYPPQILAWLFRFRASRAIADLVSLYGGLALYGHLLLGAVVLVGFLLYASQDSALDIHGSARWAGQADIAATGVLQPPSAGTLAGHDGVYLAGWRAQPRDPLRVLCNTADRHTLVLAPSRTGKGVGMVVPTLLSFSGSVVCHDMKGENYQLSAGFRSHELGQLVLRFDPTDPQTIRFNPLWEVRQGEYEFRDADDIAELCVDRDAEERASHWDKTARDLIAATILHVLYTHASPSLHACGSLLASPGTTIRDTLLSMRDTCHLGERPHPIVQEIAQANLNRSDEELSGVISTAQTALQLYRDPLIARATSVSDFRLKDLISGPLPLSLYLVVSPSEQARTHPLMRLLLNQLCRRLVETLPDSREPRHRVLLLLDEFRQLGRIPALERGLAYFAGYGVTCFLVCQNIEQLRKVYGRDEEISPGCHFRVAMTPNTPTTAQLLSQLCGDTTIHHHHVSRRLGGLLGSGQATATPSDIRRPLLTPDEVLRLPLDHALVFAQGHRPIYAERLRFYTDPEFLRRSKLPPPASDRLTVSCPWTPVRITPPAQAPLSAQIPRRFRGQRPTS